MKELVTAGAKARKGVLILDGFPSFEGDVATIRFADPAREKERQLRLAQEAAVGGVGSGGVLKGWRGEGRGRGRGRRGRLQAPKP